MKCLVTGAAGFIGSHISERLLSLGHRVVGVDCFTDYYSPDIKRKNLENLLANQNFHIVEKNLVDIDLISLLDDVDVVFHQAAQAGVRASWGKDFRIYTELNILATQRLLEACKEKSRLQKFVYASSSSVYGDTRDIPMKETSYPQPVSPYGVSKLAAEHLAFLYWKNFSVPTVSLRYFTVFGPRQRPDMAFNRFLKAGISSEPIFIYGDGEQTRDFTYISDIVDANIAAMNHGEGGSVFNTGGGARISVNNVLKIIEEIVGNRLKIERHGAQKGDVRHTYSDNTMATEKLGYKPMVSIREGLKAEYDWMIKLFEKSSG